MKCPVCGWTDEPYVPQEYPKWVDGRIVHSAEEAAHPERIVPEKLPETAPELPKVSLTKVEREALAHTADDDLHDSLRRSVEARTPTDEAPVPPVPPRVTHTQKASKKK
jgi:hypothetical protein